MRYKLLLEYDGTRYSGWQVQKNSRTIQGLLLKIAEAIFNSQKIDIQGSGRTDAGVHALAQVAHMDVETKMNVKFIKNKLNDNLPHDISIKNVENANSKFHARHSAISRVYLYQIATRRTAFGKNYVWWIKDDLNFNEMKLASRSFVGMHDFSSFSDNDNKEKSSKVLVENLSVIKQDNLILIRIQASHFLWKMVRRIIGTLVEVGRNNLSSQDIQKFLIESSSVPAHFTAPPSGLFLEKVLYEKKIFMEPINPIINLF